MPAKGDSQGDEGSDTGMHILKGQQKCAHRASKYSKFGTSRVEVPRGTMDKITQLSFGFCKLGRLQ